MDGIEVNGRPRWAVIVGAAAAGLGSVVAARLVVWLSLVVTVPALPHLAPAPSCPGPMCTFSPLHAAPTVDDLRRLHLHRPGSVDLPELGPEWDTVPSAARPWLRSFLGSALHADLSQPPSKPWPEGHFESYGRMLAEAWQAEGQRHVAERYVTDRATYRIATHRRAARRARVFAVTAPDLGLFGAWALGVGAAGVWFGRRRQVRIDAQGVQFHGERIGWDRIDAVDWYDGAVEVRLVDGALRRDRALALTVPVDVVERRTGAHLAVTARR